MKKIFIILSFLVVQTFALADDFSPYEKQKTDYLETDQNLSISLTTLPKVEDQGNLGFCYAFASRTLLEQYHCRVEGHSCSDIQEEQQLSVLDLATYRTRSPCFLKEGGTSTYVLKNVKALGNTHRISVESCASYKTLDYNYEIKVGKRKLTYASYNGGWQYLRTMYDMSSRGSYSLKTSGVELLFKELNIES